MGRERTSVLTQWEWSSERGSKPWDCYKSPVVSRILSFCLQECFRKNVLRLGGVEIRIGACMFSTIPKFFTVTWAELTSWVIVGEGVEEAGGAEYQVENWGNVDQLMVPSKNYQQSRLSWQGRCNWRPQVAGASLIHVTDLKKNDLIQKRKEKKRYF